MSVSQSRHIPIASMDESDGMHGMGEPGVPSTSHPQPMIESIDMSTSHPQRALATSMDVDSRDLCWSQESETPHPYVDNCEAACYRSQVLIAHMNDDTNNIIRSQHQPYVASLDGVDAPNMANPQVHIASMDTDGEPALAVSWDQPGGSPGYTGVCQDHDGFARGRSTDVQDEQPPCLSRWDGVLNPNIPIASP